MNLRFGSVCSGIEAASTAWEPLGWKPVFFSEIEKHPSNVLRYHWPDVPNLGDFTTIDGSAWDIDVLVGGTPCQAFSMAGRRQSLEDDRGNLTLKYVELVHDSDVPVAIWENVPGVLSAKDNAFGCFLSGLVGADRPLLPLKNGSWPGFGMVAGPRRVVAWRSVDAQYFHLAQRRERLFVVSFRTRDGRNPGAVLFEPESVPRDTPPSRGERTSAASVSRKATSHWSGGPHPALSQSHNTGGIGASNQELFSQGGAGLVPWPAEIASCLNASFGDKQGLENQHIDQGAPLFVPVGFNWQNAGNEGLAITVDGVGPLDCSQTKAIAFMPGQGAKAGSVAASEDVFPTLRAAEGGNRCPAIASLGAVRRIMPIEGDRLQGFPDDHTRYGRKPDGTIYEMPDGARYKALGNSMAVPCMAWIGRRIEMVLEATEYSKSVGE